MHPVLIPGRLCMMNATFKDHFSGHAGDYRQFRPDYPQALFSYLAGIAPTRERAWDCATGNGQAAVSLASWFGDVIATDASAEQVASATVVDGVSYRVASAENSGISTESIDLVTVAQALHWFDLEGFANEVQRVLKPGGILACWTYDLLRITPELDALTAQLYGPVLKEYWPAERKLIDSGYRTITLPLKELPAPDFVMTSRWGLDHLLGYLATWSAVKRCQRATGADAVAQMADQFREAWGDTDKRQVEWPLSVRIWQKGDQA